MDDTLLRRDGVWNNLLEDLVVLMQATLEIADGQFPRQESPVDFREESATDAERMCYMVATTALLDPTRLWENTLRGLICAKMS